MDGGNEYNYCYILGYKMLGWNENLKPKSAGEKTLLAGNKLIKIYWLKMYLI